MEFKVRNVNDAFEKLVGVFYFNSRGREEPIPPLVRRRFKNAVGTGETLTIDEPVTLTYERPWERVLFNQARDANPFFHLYESLWMLAGRNDLESVQHYCSNMKKFSDDDETLNGAYGYRWRHALDRDREGQYYSHHIDQLNVLARHLRNNPDSRRAVLQMWNVEDDLLKVDTSKDVCCNVTALFSLRTDPVCPTCNGQWTAARARELDESEAACPNCGGNPDNIFSPRRHLDLTVFNRSNDLILGMLGANAVQFSILQEYMAAQLGCVIGRYHQVTNNCHVYLNDAWKPAEWLAEYRGRTMWSPKPFNYDAARMVPLIKDVRMFEEELPAFVQYWSSAPDGLVDQFNWEEPFLRDVVAPLLHAYWLGYKQGEGLSNKVKDLLSAVESDDWREAGVSWLMRRKK